MQPSYNPLKRPIKQRKMGGQRRDRGAGGRSAVQTHRPFD